MKSGARARLRHSSFVIGLVLLLLLPAPLISQPSPPPNHVLDLDGANSWVELPAICQTYAKN